ncbi:MAG: hypothetical protein AAGK97_16940 [Bacteroidota bacterium]
MRSLFICFFFSLISILGRTQAGSLITEFGDNGVASINYDQAANELQAIVKMPDQSVVFS